MNIGNTLKLLRHGKSQKECAKEIGIPYANYNKYETTNTMPDIETLIKIADFYKITLDTLLKHEVPYLLDKSTLSPEHKELLDFILELTPAECIGAKAAIIGWLIAEDNKQQIINKLKKGE